MWIFFLIFFFFWSGMRLHKYCVVGASGGRAPHIATIGTNYHHKHKPKNSINESHNWIWSKGQHVSPDIKIKFAQKWQQWNWYKTEISYVRQNCLT